ncbi:MAG: NAD(+) synthase [Eubacteriales bacterium]
MKHGFVKVAAITPKVRVADTIYNVKHIQSKLNSAYDKGAKIIVFPELCITGYTCGDLFLQETLLTAARKALVEITSMTVHQDALVFVGLPLQVQGKLYNVAAVLQSGSILGLVPKRFMPNYAEYYEMRYFVQGNEIPTFALIEGEQIPMGMNLLFQSATMEEVVVGCELCEDAWSVNPPNTNHVMQGATIMVNLSASNEVVGKEVYRRELITTTSARLLAGYLYASAGIGESTQDLVYSGHNIIAENGVVLAESKRFENGMITTELDVHRLVMERRKNTSFQVIQDNRYKRILFTQNLCETILERSFSSMPFVPSREVEKEERCEEILMIQAYGLKKRYEHTGCKKAIIGLSGGLDSTLALLVTVKAFDLLGYQRSQIVAVTMPCFGTTNRTYENACTLAKELGVTLEEIDIKESVTKHFQDIGQDETIHNITYENGQARERTQVLMDIANREEGLVIGTGDMSELALGWATYNGDHMSMYGVNVGIPKTLVRHIVEYYANMCGEKELNSVLLDILATPVSPELLPPTDGEISQKTEEVVGPYELHDFFLYYMLRLGFEPSKIYRIARETFQEQYELEVILQWMKIFYRRFFSQQFKRSCLPDGPKVGSVALSPRGDLRMPSDASARIWLQELDSIEV